MQKKLQLIIFVLCFAFHTLSAKEMAESLYDLAVSAEQHRDSLREYLETHPDTFQEEASIFHDACDAFVSGTEPDVMDEHPEEAEELLNHSLMLFNSIGSSLDAKLPLFPQAKRTTYKDFENTTLLPKRWKSRLKSYLLPANHPVKPALDKIFGASRAIQNKEAFKAAGFHIISSRPRSFIHVASHPLLPRYLVKVQLDNDARKKRGKPLWYWFRNRCQGARRIAEIIRKKNIKNFVVAEKWVYPLPLKPSPNLEDSSEPKAIILVVKDMELAPFVASRRAWKTKFTKQHLEELYTIIKLAGGNSYRPDNVALTKQGKFAFIDTEYPRQRTDLKKIEFYLSPEMKIYWRNLIGAY